MSELEDALLRNDGALLGEFQGLRRARGRAAGEAVGQAAMDTAGLLQGKAPLQLFPDRNRDKAELIKQKSELFRQMTDHIRVMNQNPGVKAKADSQRAVIQGFFKIVDTFLREGSQASSRMAIAKLNSTTEMAKAQIAAARHTLEKHLGKIDSQTSRTYMALVDRLERADVQGSEMMGSPEMYSELVELLSRPGSILHDDAKVGVVAALNQIAMAQGERPFTEILQNSADQGNAQAQVVSDLIASMGDQVGAVEDTMMGLAGQQMIGQVKTILGTSSGGPSTDGLLRFVEAMSPMVSGMLGYAEAPEKLEEADAALDAAAAAQDESRGTDSVMEGLQETVSSLDALIAAGDSDPHWTAIRKSIISDPEYIQTAQALGLDPAERSTFKLFRQKANRQLQKHRAENRQKVRSLKNGDTVTHTPATAAAAAGGALGTEPEIGSASEPAVSAEKLTPTVDPIYAVDENGNLREWHASSKSWADVQDDHAEYTRLDELYDDDPAEAKREMERLMNQYQTDPSAGLPSAAGGMAEYTANKRVERNELNRARSRRAGPLSPE